MNNLKRNLSYQMVYQILNTGLPLITSPYLARVLGAEQQGVFSFTQSIVNYFTLAAMLGVANYGTRTIAEAVNDVKKRSREFWSIYALQFSLSLACYVVYMIYVSLFCHENKVIFLIQSFYILGSLTDINWLFFGVEKFEITVKRSIIIRITSVVLILLFVQSPGDLWIYTLIMAGGTFLTNFILWFFAPGIINLKDFQSISIHQVGTHLKPNLVLFVPLLAMSVYHIMDKTMLGILSTYEESGFYYNADKVINIPIGIINGVGTVMLPRMTAMVDSGEDEAADKLFNLSIEWIGCVAAAIALGISAISNEFTPLFFGAGFESCINLMIVLSPVLIIKGLSQASRMQYLIPHHMDNVFLQSVLFGAIINVMINLSLIPRYGAMGAVIGTLAAELLSCLWQYRRISEKISFNGAFVGIGMYVLFGGVMFIIVRLFSNFLPPNTLGVIAEICIGVLVYMTFCIVYWIFSKNDIIKMFRSNQ